MKHLAAWRRALRFLTRRHRGLKSFDQEIQAAGRLVGRAEIGIRIVPVERVVGSVGRACALRSDFFYRHGRAMTARFVRIGAAMEQGRILPPVDLYKLKRPPAGDKRAATEYYVLDGHHRVAMARRLGQDFLDARIVEYRMVDEDPPCGPGSAQSGTPEPEPRGEQGGDQRA